MTNKKLVRKVKLNKAIKILLWIFGIVLGIFLISVIGFKIWISTWQTYAEDNISVKYPNGWFVDYMNSDIVNKDEDYLVLFDNAKQSFDSSGYKTDRPEYVRIIITRSIAIKNKSLENYANNNFWTKSVDRTKYTITRSYIFINGMKTVLDFVNYHDIDGNFDKKYYYWLSKDDYVYTISRYDETSTNWFVSIFYQLVSRSIVHSFKVI
jgi:hypothetical protein